MYSRIVLPIDCSDRAWTAVGPARQLARRWGAELDVISLVQNDHEIERAAADIKGYLASFGWHDQTTVQTSVTVFASPARLVANVLADHVEQHPGSLVMLTSHGRGRSAAIFGSVAESLLRLVPAPIMIFGPAIDRDQLFFHGRMLVCVDGSEVSETALDVASPWASEFDMELWVVAVAENVPAIIGSERIIETAYQHRMADRLAAATGREVEYEALHGHNPARAVAEFARGNSGLIVAATHGRTGFDRLIGGSVAMNIVHDAPCPVLLIHSPDESTDGETWTQS